MAESTPSRSVAVFNASEHGPLLRELTEELPVEIAHVTFEVPWDEIAARRAGVIGTGGAVSPDLRAVLNQAEVIFGFGLPLRLHEFAPQLRWVETPATGYDQLTGTGVLESDVAVTTVGGLFAPWVAEHVFALLFALWRRLDEFHDAQQCRAWRVKEVRELRDATMAIVGLGNIGQAVARAAKAFGMRVIGTRRSTARPELVDRLFPRHEIHAMLAEADIVVLAIAGTPETESLIGAAELAAMQPHACLINVARGIVLDEAALADALRHRLAGAALDVFVQEPLPKDSPLWALPNLIITPHVAVNVPTKLRRCVEHFAANLARYCAGRPLADRVTPLLRGS